jgi:23S rRNA (cytidine2498-2'-O)-methyltransferase
MSERSFVWATHQVAAMRWLKAELARTAPHLQFAFARPGMTTFRVDAAVAAAHGREARGLEGLRLPSSFARAWGRSLGRASSAEQVLELLAPHLGAPLRLHVFERDVDVPADEQDATVAGRRAAAVEAALRALAPRAFWPEVRAVGGELVADVIVPHGAEPDEPYLVGVHRHDEHRGPWPGGVAHVAPPPDAPSRAWCKIEEALRWADLAPAPGDIAVEIGSAPGGATLALLRRGLTVYGIDPGEMHPLTKRFRGPGDNRFVHLHMPAAEVPKRALPRQYQWLLLDVNLAPMVALRYVERFVALAHGGLKGAVLTIKLNDEGVFVALPRLLERIHKLGAPRLAVTQLPSHRSEVVAILAW